MRKQRRCKKCLGLIPSGRCPCVSVRPRYARAAQGSVEAAHFYQIIKSIRSGSWAQTGYRAPYNPDREHLKRVYQELAGGFSIRKTSRPDPYATDTAVRFFVFRCEISRQFWRSEFDGLMGTRLILWLGGHNQAKVCDILQIPSKELRWLDGEIRRFVNFRPRAYWPHPDYLQARRKMKAGTALDIIRRRKHSYKQGQALQPQQLNRPTDKLEPIYEGENVLTTAD